MNAADFLEGLARQSFAAGVMVILVLLAQRLFRRQLTPRVRCALWLLVVIRLLAISVPSEVSIFNLLPVSSTREVNTSGSIGEMGAVVEFPLKSPSEVKRSPGEVEPVQTVSAATVPDRLAGIAANRSSSNVLFGIWLTGATLLAMGVVVSTMRLARATARGRPVDDPLLQVRMRDCADALGIRHAPTMVETEAVTTPALHGLIRPRVLLPRGFAARLSPDEQRFVFLHELAHVRRRDLWFNWFFTALQILHWFNPLIWLAFARWRADREMACDALVLEVDGAGAAPAYGRTMLRLLENFAVPRHRHGLVGILESNGQLRQRLAMIAAFTPARRPIAAVGVFVILGLVGLSDAQVPPASSPVPTADVAERSTEATDAVIADQIAARFQGDRELFLGYLKARGLTNRAYRQEVVDAQRAVAATPPPETPYVLFLVNGAETMIEEAAASADAGAAERNGEARPYLASRSTATDGEKRAAAKWQRTGLTLEQTLRALPDDKNFYVAVVFDEFVQPIGRRAAVEDQQAVTRTMTQWRTLVPKGASNLETAFGFIAETLRPSLPERVVLITDGLPTASGAAPRSGAIDEQQRIAAFKAASARLVPGVPLHTVLMSPATADPAAPGMFWSLAHATRGQLTVPAMTASEAPTHLAFVIDTSGSMRDPNTGGLWPGVVHAIEAALDMHPQVSAVQFLDGDGRYVLGRRGAGTSAWLPNTPATRESMRSMLRSYMMDTISNPMPGVANALRFLPDRSVPMRMAIYVLGDEFVPSEGMRPVLDRLDELNPRDASGRRAVVIGGIGFPTTIRTSSVGRTGIRFAHLMRLVAAEHGGTFIALPEL